ncbi:MAG: bactofilin family protein [Candidatus Binatia bacterium]
MAWFDRNPGSKKGSEAEPEKIPAVPKIVAAPVPTMPVAIAAKPEPKVEAVSERSTAGLVGYLYKGSRISGQLSFQGPARIDGIVDGEIQCQGTLTIGEGAEIRANISGQVVVIRGKVEGNVAAKEKVELAAPARLIGDVDAPRLIITEGVVFDGDCSMGAVKLKNGGVTPLNSSADKTQPVKLQADSKN